MSVSKITRIGSAARTGRDGMRSATAANNMNATALDIINMEITKRLIRWR
jgi:hypothetical protein